MEQHITTSNNTPAKKQWQKPELYILDTNDVQSGANYIFHESVQGGPGLHPAAQYHS